MTVVTSPYEAEAPAPTNGASTPAGTSQPAVAPGPLTPVPEPAGPRAPRILDWVEIPDYPGFRAKVWVNYPDRLKREAASGDEQRSLAALQQILLDHNGWLDDEGRPYPPASDPAFWDEIGLHLAVRIQRAIQGKVLEAPTSATARSGR